MMGRPSKLIPVADCTAARHGTEWCHRRYGCRCPETIAAIHQRRPPKPRLADVDEIAVERASYGDRVRLNPAERDAVVTRLTGQGLSARLIGERMGRSRRTVHRRRSAQRQQLDRVNPERLAR